MKSKILTVIAFLFLSSVSLLKAQTCSYQIVNNSACTLGVTVTWYDDTLPGCTNSCDSQSGTVNGNSVLPLTCNNCGNICNVSVTITSPYSATVDINSQSASGGFQPNTCGAHKAYTLTWNGSNATITP